jgi:hypothetical protein
MVAMLNESSFLAIAHDLLGAFRADDESLHASSPALQGVVIALESTEY